MRPRASRYFASLWHGLPVIAARLWTDGNRYSFRFIQHAIVVLVHVQRGRQPGSSFEGRQKLWV